MKLHPENLIEEFDSPLYVYDARIIEKNYNRFLSAFDIPNLQVYYACKALTNQSILINIIFA